MSERKYFRPQKNIVELPNLIEIQKQSYDWLFEEGIKELLDEISPVDDFTGEAFTLEFGNYYLDKPKVDEEMAKEKNLTYKAPLKCSVTLQNKITKRSKSAEVFLGDFPMMTDRGTFIINGIERVVVSQIVRSYGVIFVADEVAGKKYFGAKLIPNRGAWLEFETSNKGVITVKVDRKRKIPVTAFLKSLGVGNDQKVVDTFADTDDNPDLKYIETTLKRDPAKGKDQDAAMVEVYKRIRPGDLATAEAAKIFLDALFYNPKRYDLGKVGRYKINRRLDVNVKDDLNGRILRKDDVIEVIKEIIRLNNDSTGEPDDIDHLKNRRVRSVGELVQSRLRVGFLRMERIIKDRMSVVEPDSVTPIQLVNSRPIVAVLQEFFASSQMSQFMVQTNPLAELEHKRTLSATGPGGLSRERAGFEVRDVHQSHYGRICPIETPEGPNIGLIGYLASFARINEYGFIETPYLVVEKKNGQKRVTDKLVYLDASEEERVVIAPSSTEIDKKGYLKPGKIQVREYGKPSIEKSELVDYIDVSPMQIASITTALIPFVEHDDAVRANMGSNMQRQAVPLLRPESPYIGTGMEGDVAKSSGHLIISDVRGIVKKASADEIIVLSTSGEEKKYRLQKFIRSNQATCMNQKPIVEQGQKIKPGDILADGPSTDNGELAIGMNLKVAFLSFDGDNYEDAIILSERLVKDDIFTSIHIEKHAINIRDTKLGPELITRDIPNVGEDALANLDENGIVLIGAEVEAGNILVGKISPKGETELSAEEKLLRAIFGEKAKDVKDTSLRLPHGQRGKVVGVKILSKEAGDELPEGVYQLVEVSVAELRKVSVGDKLSGRHGNKGVISKILPVEDMPILPDGTHIDIILNPLGVVSRMNLGQILETHLGWVAEKDALKIATPIFNGASVENVEEELKRAGLPANGKVRLVDGRTGEPFDEETTIGIIYMLKLSHLVDDKMHARSIGPYSMVTQQPLGGKAQFGGQRFGEMEVWALEAYGAAYTLQEMLTIKSDDVIGRSKAYESIIRGEKIQKPSVPASFNVLVRELQSLGLSVEMSSTSEKSESIEREKIERKEETQDKEKETIAKTKEDEGVNQEDRELTEIKAGQEEKPLEKFEPNGKEK
ncbi:DNA-directed RNA polymerase subunit beta [Candidatus Berkelbacteria bacterium CG10_big_fil_rev_8_21_14_0_10_41_12]|uniref:DNA-directed RNA polymerase subunit beta n=1 Tax=Candidatus Berkelbacteria bacterium CG10_big_fil_rev_8_21_14_0_10_41_12 TaxID=1974513 RepID=A0A2M6WXT6_9BACT|nr:MAG: DNA-directed RNA polymerase subunit beta [Candidatus Berkelbacteria bacterium CG10_big_fil_rev_8_21_14_0_10_41_12]